MNVYGTKPVRVHLNDEIYYFYFPRDGLTKHDYEPAAVKEDRYHRVVCSRYHWRLITVWTNLILLEDKPKISFVLPWHTPVLHCTDLTTHLGIPEVKVASTNIKKKILAEIENRFIGLPIPYSDVITEEIVDQKYTYSFTGMFGMVIIGSLDNLPTQIREEIARMSILFR